MMRCRSPNIGILQYSAGNSGSVQRALLRLGIPHEVVREPSELSCVSGLIFPGVGAAASAMDDLSARGFVEPLRTFTKPFLGLCLGMQILFESSEEGQTECLGVIKGRVQALSDSVVKPHMGWNMLNTGEYAYFVHSYVCAPEDPRVVTMTTRYGGEVCAGVRQQNFFGVQWHPEKSGDVGSRLLFSFALLCV